jgi:octaprenyl-diphosphate synthase
MQTFRNIVKTDFEAVDQLILSQLHSEVRLIEQIGHYLIEAGGKRLRPLLVLLAARASGYKANRHIELAVIIEFVHTATLLHDDVVDTSEMRRGQFTANTQWGNAPSILVGDFLYSRAFQIMVGLDNIDIMRVLADTTNIISEGEVQQLEHIGNSNLDEQAYLQVIGNKTAQLFEGAGHAAAILSNADATHCRALKSYGWHLGTAFQLVDDALDYDTKSLDLDKDAGDDLAEGKVTLPLIHAMSHGTDEQVDFLRKTISDRDSSQLEKVVAIINDTSSLTYTSALAKNHAKKAQQSIALLPPSMYRSAMHDLADFAVERTF